MFAAQHPDVSFKIHLPKGGTETLREWGMTAGRAITLSAATGRPTLVDVIIKSQDGAMAWLGGKGVERYQAYFGNKVFQRLAISVQDLGTLRNG